MKITDLRCARIGRSLVVRVCTDEGIDGFGELGPYRREQLREHVSFYRDFLTGQDPTQVERTMLRIRRLGGMKPWGSAVSAIEMALWDLAGKVAGLPVHRLLGGKVRDRVRVYNGQVQYPSLQALRDGAEGFTLCKTGTGYHGGIRAGDEGFVYGELDSSPHAYFVNRGPLTERGLRRMVEGVTEAKEQLGDQVGLAVDCGPGWSLHDAVRFAHAVEPLNLVWLEDLLAGDYTPNAGAHLYRELTHATTTPIHTGEQIYRRENFRELVETRAVDVIGPDPLDVGGIAELKWVAEYADLHGIAVAPHGVGNGLLGLGALIQVCATLPQNFIAFEYPVSTPEWYEIVEGLVLPIVRDGHIEVSERPGLGVSLVPEAARAYLSEQDKEFFD